MQNIQIAFGSIRKWRIKRKLSQEGLVQGYIFEPALDVIHEHPTGPQVKESPNNL